MAADKTRMGIVIDLQDVTLRVARGELNRKSLDAELRRVIRELSGGDGTKPKNLGKKTELNRITRVVFEHWREVMGRPTAKLTDDRRVKIRARAREGYTVQQMKLAVDGCASSPYHMGSNDQNTTYNELTFILRTGSKLEDFMQKSGDASDIEAAEQTPATTKSAVRRKLEAEANVALSKDEFERYESIQRRLAEI